jgi:single-stranded DNA-specific DHH superfamily exonuclease
MAIPPEALQEFRSRVIAAARPLILYDDDGDGLCSYLLCNHARHGDDVGIRVHTGATVSADYLAKVELHQPDLVVILDKPYLDPAFAEGCKVPILWLDHHAPQQVPWSHVTYYNPRLHDDADNRCTTHWVWHALGEPKDLWLAAVGSISDWQMTDIAEGFRAEHGELLAGAATAPEALFDAPFGELARIVQFNLKGDARDVREAIELLRGVTGPQELLLRTTKAGRKLGKRYDLVRTEYERLLALCTAAATDDPILFHVFGELEISLVGELANELIHRYPDKVVVLARSSKGDHKLSIRSASVPVAHAVAEAMRVSQVRGNAGGHTHACGGKIPDEDFPRFYAAFRDAMGFPARATR